MEQHITDILKQSKLSITEARKIILELFHDAEASLSHADIEKAAKAKLDRVTVYRTLQTFVEKGIIHTIPTDDNGIRYAMCHGGCAGGHHHDDHVHFICDTCGDATCINEVTVPNISLPSGFVVKDVELVVKGICGKCSKRNS